MSEEQVTRNQHYIPQFYLRGFTGPDKKVEVLSCERNKLLPRRNPKSIGCEPFFYGAETGVSDQVSQEAEDFFKHLEDSLAKKIPFIERKILGGQQLSEDERWTFAFLMGMLWIRGPVMREQNQRMVEDLMQQMMQLTVARPKEDVEAFFNQFDRSQGRVTSSEDREKIIEIFKNKDYKLNVNNVFHISMFQDIHRYANLFAAKDWFVYINQGKKRFVTSDNPVVEIFPPVRTFYGTDFFSREHYFAFSPKILIYCKTPNKKNSKKLRRRTLFDRDARKVLELNMILATHALKYMYGREKEDFEEILFMVDFIRKKQLEALRKNTPSPFI